MASLGELTPAAAPAPSWASALPSLATAVAQFRYQDKVLRTNLDREKAGLKPLDVEQYQPGVKVGIDPGTRRMVLGGIALAVLGAIIAAAITRKGKK